MKELAGAEMLKEGDLGDFTSRDKALMAFL